MRIFVYGTLRSDAASVWHERLIRPVGTVVGSGRVAGRLYDLGLYPGLVPPRFCSERVRGEVWEVQASVIPALDRYEGTRPYVAPPAEYRRDRALVRMDDGRLISAWVYYYQLSTGGARRIRSGDYLAA